MGDHPRKADGRRVFSTEFKRTTVQRILSGEKTLAELSRELDISPSVILCDLRMPGMDGFEFIRRLRWTQAVHAPVIAVLGLSSAEDRERTRRTGFHAHLSKPFDYAARSRRSSR